jgi:hypothetical protein
MRPPRISLLSLPPGAIQTASPLSVGDFVHDDSTFKKLTDEILNLEMWGTIDYADAFGVRRSDFSAVWEPKTACTFITEEND